jgi:hypothetical protein
MLTMPFYFWIDDLHQVERNLSGLELTAEKYSLAPFHVVALGLKGRYLIRIGQAMDGVSRLRDSLEKLRILRYEMLVADFISELAVSLAKQDDRVNALVLIDGSIAAQYAAKRPLHRPALLLAKGLVFLSGEAPKNTSSAQGCSEEAMTLAAQQSARSFELPAALELARLWIDRGQIRRARDLIAPIYNRFTEGLATPDLILAKRMLKQAGIPARQAG